MAMLPELDDMALFVEVARAGNFSRACERLGMPNATLSRRVAAMEKRLGLLLFERSTRHMALTEPAQRYFERCTPLVDEARLAHEALRGQATRPEGHVRVSMPVDLGTIMLGPWLPEFLRQHPGITLDLDMSPRFADLRTEPIDLAFRLGTVRGDGLVARRIGEIASGLYAAPTYLDRQGRPRKPEDLADHPCLHIGSAKRGAVWAISDGAQVRKVKVRGPVGLNSMSLTRQLAERGMGVALLPLALAAPGLRAGSLEAVLPRCETAAWAVYAVTTSRLQVAAVRALVDFAQARFALMRSTL
jgi:DNA-binding transcriptional LysR family regulator